MTGEVSFIGVVNLCRFTRGIDSAVSNTHTRPHEAETFNARSMRPANRQPHRSQFVRRQWIAVGRYRITIRGNAITEYEIMTRLLTRSPKVAGAKNGFVVDGYARAIDGVTAEIRSEIEQKYADQWNRSGFIKRWFLKRRMNNEIATLVAERSKHISPDAWY